MSTAKEDNLVLMQTTLLQVPFEINLLQPGVALALSAWHLPLEYIFL